MEAACALCKAGPQYWGTNFEQYRQVPLHNFQQHMKFVRQLCIENKHVLMQRLWRQLGNIWRISGWPLYIHPCIWFDHLITAFHSGVAVPITFSVKVAQPLWQASHIRTFHVMGPPHTIPVT
jgi:hypothetical protein